MLVFFVLACATQQPAAITEGCAPYAGMPSVHGFCITSMAGGLDSAAACEAAGRWQDRCRTVWVEARLHPSSGTSDEVLLAACGDANCRLDVLDFRAESALLPQVERCGQWAAENAPHCVSHAVQRWRAGQPSAEELATIASWEGILSDWLGHHLAEAVVCDRIGSCAGSAVVEDACEQAAVALRSGQSECHSPQNAPRPMR